MQLTPTSQSAAISVPRLDLISQSVTTAPQEIWFMLLVISNFESGTISGIVGMPLSFKGCKI